MSPGRYLLLLLLFFGLIGTSVSFSPTNQSVCTATADAGPDQAVCMPGAVVNLQGSFTGNVISHEWSPATGLSDPFNLTPTATIFSTTTYTLTVFENTPQGANLVINGDFSAGNSGFSTDYAFQVDVPGDQMELWPEGTFSIVNNPNNVHLNFSPCSDHTGGGDMMVINGSAALQSVWCQNVPVNPNTPYNFSAWLASVHPASPAQLQFSINGTPIGNVANASSTTCNWIPFNALWNSGGATTAEICIINLNTQPSGNDFAIDDIFFTEICQATDEVTIHLLDVEAIINPPALVSCNDLNDCQILDATLSTSGPDVTYQWTTVGGSIISGMNSPTPQVCGVGTYELTVSQTLNGVTCTATASVQVLADNVVPPPPILTGNALPCPGQLETYCVEEEDAYDTYFWSLPDGGNIVSGQGTSCIVVDWSDIAGSLGQVCVFVENACGIPNQICTFVLVQNFPYGNMIIGDVLVCEGIGIYTALNFDPLLAATVWSIPGDAVLISGQGTGSIAVDWTGSSGGLVCVETTEPCGTTDECVNVVVTPQYRVFLDTTICQGDSIFLAGAFQNTPGVYNDSFPINLACDSLVFTTLSVLPADTTYHFFASCNPLDTGLVVLTWTNQEGCDSVEIIQTDFFPSGIETNLTAVTCIFSEAGMDTVVLANNIGCDSTVITTTTYVQADTLYNTLTSCDSLSVGVDTIIDPNSTCPDVEIITTIYVGSDPTFTFAESCFPADTGLVSITHQNEYGCDSVEFIQTDLLPSSQKDSLQFTCTASEAGVDTMILINQNLCDSFLIITTEFVSSDTLMRTDTTCNPAEVGVEVIQTPVPGACFLIEIVTTIFVEPIPVNTLRETCDPSEVGTVLVSHPLPNGCDSLEFVNTVLVPSTQKDSMDFTCDISQAGIDTIMLVNQNLCDSFLIITTEFVNSDTLMRTDTTCNPAEVGVEVIQTPIPGGCFLIEIVTTIFVEPIPVNTLRETCDPSEVGTVLISHPLPNGCDSLEFVNTVLVPSTQKDSIDFTCDISQAGLDTILLINQGGCDSLLIINTSFVSSDTTYRSESTCDPMEAGIDTLTTPIPGGCFIVEIVTTVFTEHTPIYLFAESCFPADTGLVVITLADVNGCDSLIFIETTLLESSQIDSMAFTCSIGDAGIDTSFYTNQNGCNSLLIINTQYVGSDTVFTQVPSCDSMALGFDTVSVLLPGACYLVEITETYFEGIAPVFTTGESCVPQDTGLVVIVHQSQEGCDSIEYRQISLTPIIINTSNAPTCFMDSVSLDTFYLQTPAGCDSLQIQNTYFVPSDTSFMQIPTCDIGEVGTTVTVDPIPGGCFQMNIIDRYYVGSNPVFTTGTSCNPQDTGLQVIVHLNQFLCDSLEYLQINLLPSDQTYDTLFTCDITQSGVDTFPFNNQYGCDSLLIVTTTFIDNDTLYDTQNTCDLSLAGVDTLVTQIVGGCFLVEITETIYVGSAPTFTSAASCNPLDTGLQIITHLNQYNCDSVEFLQIDLWPSSIEFFNATTCDIMDVGVDTIFESNQFGCDSLLVTTTTLLDEDFCFLNAVVQADPITCLETEGAFSLEVLVGEAPFNYQWDGPGTNPLNTGTIDDKNEIVNINGLAAGDYSITVSSNGGLVTILQVTITQEAPVVGEAEITSDFGQYDIACAGDENGAATANAISGGIAPYSYEWSNGAFTQEVNDLAAGIYYVSIFDSQGCLAIDSVDLREPTPIELDLVFTDPRCFGYSDGSIELSVVQGGVAPYVYSLNQSTFQSAAIFTNLSSGVFELEVMDVNGCTQKEFVSINTPTPLTVNLGEDRILDLGDSTQLNAVINIPFETLDSLQWSEDLCDKCTDPFVFPLVTSAYSVRIEDANGCEAMDNIQVQIRKDRAIYWPNGFSPNGDGENETFYPFAGKGVQRIVQMEIYDRWGEEVFQASNFQANDPARGWDGKFKGEYMNPGVFVWWGKVEFIDGDVILFSGDVTLVR